MQKLQFVSSVKTGSEITGSRFSSHSSKVRKATGYHLVDISPWPFTASMSVMGLTSSMVGLFHLGSCGIVWLFMSVSVALLVLTMFRWWGDIIMESTYLGRHTSLVVKTLRMGMMLFILSEVFFFVSFFWAFFYGMIGEISMNKVGQWPPVGVKAITPWKVPALNTVVLLSSGATVTWAHKAVRIHNKCPVFRVVEPKFGFSASWSSAQKLFKTSFFRLFLRYESSRWGLAESHKKLVEKRAPSRWKSYSRTVNNRGEGSKLLGELKQLALDKNYYTAKKSMGEKYRRQTLWALGLTVALGIFFSSLQFHEYYMASFTIAEGIYGSTFYMMTGFHGVHVLVGTIFLTVVFFRTYYYHFCQHLHYFGFDAAVWYWHFVDVVWIGLFGAVYIWGYL